jgi:hypothetical protein
MLIVKYIKTTILRIAAIVPIVPLAYEAKSLQSDGDLDISKSQNLNAYMEIGVKHIINPKIDISIKLLLFNGLVFICA